MRLCALIAGTARAAAIDGARAVAQGWQKRRRTFVPVARFLVIFVSAFALASPLDMMEVSAPEASASGAPSYANGGDRAAGSEVAAPADGTPADRAHLAKMAQFGGEGTAGLRGFVRTAGHTGETASAGLTGTFGTAGYARNAAGRMGGGASGSSAGATGVNAGSNAGSNTGSNAEGDAGSGFGAPGAGTLAGRAQTAVMSHIDDAADGNIISADTYGIWSPHGGGGFGAGGGSSPHSGGYANSAGDGGFTPSNFTYDAPFPPRGPSGPRGRPDNCCIGFEIVTGFFPAHSLHSSLLEAGMPPAEEDGAGDFLRTGNTLQSAAAPEPASVVLLALGLAMLGLSKRRRGYNAT